MHLWSLNTLCVVTSPHSHREKSAENSVSVIPGCTRASNCASNSATFFWPERRAGIGAELGPASTSLSYGDLVLDKRHKVCENISSIANDLLSGLGGPQRKNGRCSCSDSEGCITCGGICSPNSVGIIYNLTRRGLISKVIYLDDDKI